MRGWDGTRSSRRDWMNRFGGPRNEGPVRRAIQFWFTEIVSSEKSSGTENNSLYQNREQSYISCIPSRPEGRSRSSRTRGGAAMDAEVPLTKGTEAYGKDVWS